MSIYLKNESDFTGPIENVNEIHDLSIKIDILYHVDDNGKVILDINGMLNDIQDNLSDVEFMIDEFNQSK